jgi:hypothetical protein
LQPVNSAFSNPGAASNNSVAHSTRGRSANSGAVNAGSTASVGVIPQPSGAQAAAAAEQLVHFHRTTDARQGGGSPPFQPFHSTVFLQHGNVLPRLIAV